MLRLAWLALLLAGCHSSYAITGSSTTKIESHPYTVAVDKVIPVYDDEDIIDYDVSMMCAGALLSSKTVIVAASCFLGADDVKNVTYLRVRVGSQLREGGGEAFAVAATLVHPDWEDDSADGNDVMLVYLAEEVAFRAEVQAVALTAPGALAAGDKLVMTGYGDLSANEVLAEGETRQLQVATLAVVNQDVCDEVYGNTWTTIGCAGGLGAGVCGSRDEGAPLVNWRGELVGLALLQSDDCGLPGVPTTFTDLAEAGVNAWVSANMDMVPSPDDRSDLGAITGRRRRV